MNRKIGIFPIMLAAVALLAFGWTASAQELKVGDMAPNFTLQASDGKTYTLSALKGKTVVLAWFPKAFTGG
jgi:peroxiredoxin Q/BCP